MGADEFFKRIYLWIILRWNSITDAGNNEPSYRSCVWAELVSAGLAFCLPLTAGELALILALGVMVLAFEAINTAVELTIDYISKDRHPEAGRAKDAASAAVFLSAIAAWAAWAVVLWRVSLG